MKICYIGDANAIHLQRWVQWFASEHEVAVISTTPDPGLEQHKVAVLPAHDARMRLARSLALVRRVLRRMRPHVLHSHFINEAGWLGAASGWRPLVVTAWGSDVYRAPAESLLARRLNPWALRRAQAVTCDSEDQARIIRSWGVSDDRLSVIGWGVDLAEFHPDLDRAVLRRALDIPLYAPLVLSPRQWYANSNIPTVVAAHAQMPADVYLLLKRAPDFEPDGGVPVQRAISCSPARERIRVLDEIQAERLPVLYAAADVVISICTTDGTPVSVLEAMALGRPVVALQNPSVAEWVSEPGGRLVGRLDPALLAQALDAYLRDGDLRRRASEHNRAVVEARADREVEFARMAEIYARLRDRGARPRVAS